MSQNLHLWTFYISGIINMWPLPSENISVASLSACGYLFQSSPLLGACMSQFCSHSDQPKCSDSTSLSPASASFLSSRHVLLTNRPAARPTGSSVPPSLKRSPVPVNKIHAYWAWITLLSEGLTTCCVPQPVRRASIILRSLPHLHIQ